MNIKITKKHLDILKELSHEVWGSYSDEFGYQSEKQRINASMSTDNPDNIWFFWNQFDAQNHLVLFNKLLIYVECSERIDLIAWMIQVMKEEQDAVNKFHESISHN